MKKPTLIKVFGQADGVNTFLGTLSHDHKNCQGAFAWSEEALKGHEWSPVYLPLSSHLWTSGERERDLDGLPGFIHDSLPDGWGILLQDKSFLKKGISRGNVSPLMRLAFLKDNCWGALSFEPEWGADVAKKQQAIIEDLSEEAQHIEYGDTDDISEALLMAGGSPHGARPKIAVCLSNDNKTALTGENVAPSGYRNVLIKFAAKNEDPSAPLLEYYYNAAAKAFGIDIFPATYLDINGRGAVCFDRFDRQRGQRQHVHSMAGMLHITHRVANADWMHIRDILLKLKGGEHHLPEAFRRAVFNAVFCVRDDHAKNHAFIRNLDGTWALTPAFDIAYSDGPGGYHTLTYNNHISKNVLLSDLLNMAPPFHVEQTDAKEMIEKAKELREEILGQAKNGVTRHVLLNIKQKFKEIDKNLKTKTAKLK